MNVRRILGIAIFCGVAGSLGEPQAQAGSGNPAQFVQVLLNKEVKQIFTTRNLIAQQNYDEAQLAILQTSGATDKKSVKMISKLQKMINSLQNKINNSVGNLSSLENQVASSATTPFKSLAAQYAAVANTLIKRPPFGIPATTTFQ